ncbi:MAG TPA: hypothetical protein V6D17_16075 [Candidatus Obscuribacterales bacterium]
MGQFDRIQTAEQNPPPQKDGVGKVVDEVSSSIFGYFKRGRKHVEEQVQNIDTEALQKQMRGVGEEVQRHVQREAQGLQEDVDKARRGDPSALINRGMDMAGKYSAPGVAFNTAKRFGVFNKLPGFVERGAEELTKVDTKGFVDNVDKIFTTVDANKDGHLEKAEIEEAKKDKIFWAQYAFTLKYLGDKYDTLTSLSNDEWFGESKISREDISALRHARENGTGFGTAFGHAADGAISGILPSALAAGGAAALSSRSLRPSPGSIKVGLITGAAVLTASTIYGAADYLLTRRGKLETTIKDLG